MRSVTVAVVLAGACACGALAQPRILPVEEQAAPPAQQEVPAPAPPQAAERPPAPPQAAAPAVEPPPKMQEKIQDQMPQQAEREDRVPPPPARFSFQKVYDGYLRLDRETGEVAFCAPRAAGWTCEIVPQERAQLEKQIDALRNEVKALQREIVDLRRPPPPPLPVPAPPRAADDGGRVTITLPSREDIARARGFLADTWRRLVDMIQHWQKDVLGKG